MSAFQQVINPNNTASSIVELDARTNFLRDSLNKAAVGKSLVRLNVPVSPDVQIGHAVYWNQTSARYERSMAILTVDPASGNLVATNQSQCVGLCVAKNSALVANICVSGYVTATPTMLTNMTGSTSPVPGLYYLSVDTPGKCVKSRPGVPVHVAYIQSPSVVCGIDYEVLVIPGVEDLVSDHVHLQFEMVALPAGTHTPPALAGVHVISPANSAQAGWLPAADPIFNGRAPVGAKFGYNLSQHPLLNRQWPPVPADALVLEFTDYDSLPERVGGLRRVDPTFYQVNDYGLWWMSDCWGQVPWDRTLDTTAVVVPPVGCITSTPVRMYASFSKATFATKDSAVLRLKGDPLGILSFVDPDGIPAQTGYLTAKLSPESGIDATPVTGSSVLKGITPGTFKFTKGFVVEGLVSASSELAVSGTITRLLDPLLPAGPANPVIHQGVVSLAYSASGAVIDLPAATIWLGDSLQREFLSVRYIGFPQGRDSALTLRFDVPYDNSPGPFTLQAKVAVLLRVAGPAPAMPVTYYVVRRPDFNLPQVLNGGTGPISVPFNIVTATTGRPQAAIVHAEVDPVGVYPGDTVFMTFSREAATSAGYLHDVGFIRVSGLLVKAPNWTAFPA